MKVECAAHLPSVTRANPVLYAIVMAPVDLVLFRMCSPEGGVAGAGDEGNKQLIERDKVDVELRVCVLVMNASNKMCLTHMTQRGEEGSYSCGLLVLWCVCVRTCEGPK